MSQQYFYPVQPVDGTITATNPSVGPIGSTSPSDATLIGALDGSSNLQALTETGGALNVNITGSASEVNVNLNQVGGASFALGQQLAAASLPIVLTASQLSTLTPLATVTANQGTANATPWNQNLSQVGGSSFSLGQQLAAASLPIVLTAAQITTLTPLSTVTVIQPTAANLNATITGTVAVSNFPATQPISGTVTANQGTANATPWNQNLAQVGGTSFALGQQLAAASLPVVLTASQLSTLTPLTSVTVTQGTAANLNATVTGTVAATQSGTWNITNISGTVSLPTGAATSANQTNATQKTQIVDGSGNVIASTSNALNVQVANASIATTPQTSSTSTLTSVAGATSSTSLLSSNASRKGMYVFNDSTAVLYLAFAGSASTTAYTVQIASNGFYEMPNPTVYTGAIFGIWSAATGNARLTELS